MKMAVIEMSCAGTCGHAIRVTVTHLVTAGTIDRRVLSSLAGKDFSQAALIGAVKTELETQLENKEKK